MVTETPRELHFGNIVKLLREEFKNDEYDVTNMFEKERSLPIDIFCSKKKGKKEEYCIVLVSASNYISHQYQRKLLFYQYYLSQYYDPSQYKIILAIPESSSVDTEPFYAQDEEEKSEDFYKVNGFGLWKIKYDHSIDKESCPAITLREKITRDYYNLVKKRKGKQDIKIIDILPFVDKYIHDSILAIAKHYEIKFDERNIDQKLLELILDLTTVPYKDKLASLINEHLSTKDIKDIDFCTNVFNELWREFLHEDIYPREHRNLENLLIELYPKYRDHYIHQLQVFLLGTFILDVLIQNNKIEPNNGFPCISWLLAASFHDFAYPIQNYDDYVSRYFQECLGTCDNWDFLGLKYDYSEKSFSSSTEHILSSLSNCLTDDCSGENRTNNMNVIRNFFTKRLQK